jgi:hypothetical protein
MRINANRFEVKTMAVHGFQQDLTVVHKQSRRNPGEMLFINKDLIGFG